MRLVGAGILCAVLAVMASGCCFPLYVLDCCLASVPNPNLSAKAAIDADRALGEVPTAPAVEAAAQKF
jgi:hypothetical protein